MEIIIRKTSYFTFRGKNGGELDLLGIPVGEHMIRFLIGGYDALFDGVSGYNGKGAARFYSDGALPAFPNEVGRIFFCGKEGAGRCGFPAEGDGGRIVLDDCFPFLEADAIQALLKATSGNVSFEGGSIERESNAPFVKIARPAAFGIAVQSLAGYAEAVEYAGCKLRKRLLGQNVFIDRRASVGYGAVVHPDSEVLGESVLRGRCVIGKGCTIESSYLVDCEIGEGSAIRNSVLERASVGRGATVGPFARLRPDAHIGDGVNLGNFVEVKNAAVGNGSKAAHLAYIGDAEIGEGVNIGCGAIFVNYNGKEKSRSSVGDRSFIGSNCNVIAPVSIGNGVFVAAGTTVTSDLQDGDFCIGRSRQEVKKSLADRYLK